MLVPSTLERLKKGDFSIRPFTVHKDFTITYGTVGYTVRQGYYYKNPLPISSSRTLVTNAATSSDGTYNYQTWRSTNHLYYRDPYSVGGSFEGFNRNKTDKRLYLTASLISAPFNDMGEGIKKGSIIITGSEFYLRDDANHNIYDVAIDSSSYVDSSYLDAYWGFQDLYHKTVLGYGNALDAKVRFYSNTREEDIDSILKNVNLSPGVKVNNTSSGAQIDFTGTSYVETPFFEEINYEKDEDFTISFWLKAPALQSEVTNQTNSLISKKTYANVLETGIIDVYNDKGIKMRRQILSASIKEDVVDYYPYDFEIYNQSAGSNNGKVRFRRSDGFSILNLTSSIAVNDGLYHNICLTKSNNALSLYVDGDFQASGSDLNDDPTNVHHLFFGANDKDGGYQFSGSMDEIRFYNTGATSAQVSGSLAEKYQGKLYQTSRVGNAFYGRGEIILTSPIPKYHEYFKRNDWTLKYKNNYTIYEYEALVRIKPGKFNKTMNPSSTKSPKSPLYLDEFTSGSLTPYITTIGLYDSNNELLAVGKLGRPLKKRTDVTTNIIIRWDY